MSDKPQIKLAETVVLIDAAFLNFVITDIKGYFEETLHRSLQEIDLSMLTTYITLDAGITEGKNEVQFVFGFTLYRFRFGRREKDDRYFFQ